MKHWIQLHWLKVVAIIMLVTVLFLAVNYPDGGNPMPFAFYQLMTWVVSGAAIVTAKHASDKNRVVLTWVFIVLAVIFNPLQPILMRQDIWQIAS